MCGIVYSMNLNGKAVAPTILKRYQGQRNRGTEGFGFYMPKINKLTHNTKEGRTLRLLKRQETDEILFHHRFPTSTENVRNACHPFSTKDFFENNYVVVHNGVVRNTTELRKQHEELGITYVSMQENGRFNDSEALAYDLARYFEGDVESLTAGGTIAFIAIKRDKGGKPVALMFGRNHGNPLVMKKTTHSITISSQGEGEVVEANMLHVYHYDTGEITKTALTIPSGYVSSYSPHPYNGGYTSPQSHLPYRSSDTSTYNIPARTGSKTEDDYELEEDEVEERLAYHATVGTKVKDLQYDAMYDDEKALEMAQEELGHKVSRFQEIDDISRDEEAMEVMPQSEMEDLIQEYVELEEEIALMKEVVTQLEREVKVTAPYGFHSKPKEEPTTNLFSTHRVPGASSSTATASK